MSRVVISGYYGFGNAGDEAILDALLQGLRSRLPGVGVTVLSANPEDTRREHAVDAIGRLAAGPVVKALRGADLLISGGGSLLQDATGPFNIPYYLGVVELAHRLGVETVLLGQGVGPVDGRLGRLLIRLLANRVAAVTVRDQGSARFLADLGVTRPAVAVTADLVFALALEGDGAAPASGDGEAWVGVCLRERGLTEASEGLVAEALGRFAAGAGVRLLLVPMHSTQDLPLAVRLQEVLGANIARLAQVTHWRDVVAALKGCGAVIAMRLHALIFSALLGRLPLGLSPDPKVDGFLARLGMGPLARVDRLTSAGDLAAELIRAYRDRSAAADSLDRAVARLRREADRNFDVIMNLLGRVPAPAPHRLQNHYR